MVLSKALRIGENMDTVLNENCPCKRSCERHGNCEACKTHHLSSKILPTCERIAQKKTKEKKSKSKE